ncbi:tetratricopeptide repeat protein [Thermocrinis minervae]|uniref:Tetratricopeptide repeat-containing protein n=1 Tax=Thermocrinis minervae TaxID=381751 RepID=A0A1M6Q9A3_9AQUI|nr:tetratricopeptide repeat protein [Thermocrinis minervae]SHK16874.1 Tetratricopeptide repeat-containing protein [Thermocrinis minervae]
MKKAISALLLSVSISLGAPKEYYKTMLEASLGINDLKTAQRVLEDALREYPNDVYFLEWAYKVYLWSSDLEKAGLYAERFYRATKNYDENIIKVLRVAGRYDTLLDIYEKELSKGNFDFLQEYYKAIIDSFQIDRGLKFLENLYKNISNIEVLKIIAKLDYDTNKFERAKDNILRVLSKDNQWLDGYIFLYKIFYAQKNYEEAYRVLKTINETFKNVPEYVKRDLLSIAYGLGKLEDAYKVAKQLRDEGKADKDVYTVMLEYLIDKNPIQARDIAIEAYEKTKLDYFLDNYILLSYRLEDYMSIVKIVEQEKLQEKLKPYTLDAVAQAYYRLGYKDKALRLYESYLSRTFDTNVLSSLLYFLAEAKDYERLKNYTDKYYTYALKTPELYLSFLNAYIALQDSKKGLAFYQQLKEKNDLFTKYLYSFLLDIAGEEEKAKALRYQLLKELEKKPEAYQDTQLAQVLLSLYSEFKPVDYLKIKDRLRKTVGEKAYWETYLTYLASNMHYEKYSLYARSHREAVRAWMELSKAIEDYDKDKLAKLVEEKSQELPVRDRVRATQMAGNIGLAKEYAFEGLEKNPTDYLMYKQFRDLYMNFSGNLTFETSYQSGKYLQTESINLDLKHPLTNRLYFLISSSLNKYTSLRGDVIKKTPSKDLSASVGLKYIGQRTNWELLLTQRDAFTSYTGFSLKIEHYLKDRLTGMALVEYRQPAQDSVYTIVGGRKNSITLGVTYSLNTRTYIDTTYSYQKIESQDGKSVGDAKKLNVEGFYKLRVSYPDFTFRAYYMNYQYSEKNKDKGVLDEVSATPTRYLPTSFWESGLGFLFGFDQKHLYTGRLRPFADISIGYNSQGTGVFSVGGGLGGPLFHQDNLSLDLSLSRRVGRFTENILNANMIYKLWY